MPDDKESVVGTSPPPRKSDVLFGLGNDWEANACVNSFDDTMAYEDGYRRAALHLAKYVCDERRGQDFLVYPIVYLYRHHIELRLKSIISVSSILLRNALTEGDRRTLGSHDLAKLWDLARPLLNPICERGGSPPLPMDDLEGIDFYILQLHEHDPNGQQFRYATTKSKGSKTNQARSLPADLRHINIRNFAVAMEKLADYLEGLDSWFGDLLDAELQCRAEYL